MKTFLLPGEIFPDANTHQGSRWTWLCARSTISKTHVSRPTLWLPTCSPNRAEGILLKLRGFERVSKDGGWVYVEVGRMLAIQQNSTMSLYALLHNAHTTTRTKNLAHNVSWVSQTFLLSSDIWSTHSYSSQRPQVTADWFPSEYCLTHWPFSVIILTEHTLLSLYKSIQVGCFGILNF